jgi:hypothetical protein
MQQCGIAMKVNYSVLHLMILWLNFIDAYANVKHAEVVIPDDGLNIYLYTIDIREKNNCFFFSFIFSCFFLKHILFNIDILFPLEKIIYHCHMNFLTYKIIKNKFFFNYKLKITIL